MMGRESGPVEARRDGLRRREMVLRIANSSGKAQTPWNRKHMILLNSVLFIVPIISPSENSDRGVRGDPPGVFGIFSLRSTVDPVFPLSFLLFQGDRSRRSGLASPIDRLRDGKPACHQWIRVAKVSQASRSTGPATIDRIELR